MSTEGEMSLYDENETVEASPEKTQAKDASGKPKKAEAIPSVKDIICPFIYKLTGGAIRYDIQFAPTMKLGDGPVGCWRSAPQITLIPAAKAALEDGSKSWKDIVDSDIAVNEKGAKSARGYALQFYQALEFLQTRGKITWEEKAYFFTHEAGVAARESYIQDVLTGKRKANRRSWVGTPGDPEKPGFGHWADVPWESLVVGEVPNASTPIKSFEWCTDKTTEMTLGEHLRSVYSSAPAKQPTAKSTRRKAITDAMNELGIELPQFTENITKLAEMTGLSNREVQQLIVGDTLPEKDDPATAEVEEEKPRTLDELTEPSSEELDEIEHEGSEDLVAGIAATEVPPMLRGNKEEPIEEMNGNSEDDDSDDPSLTAIEVPSDPDKERIAFSAEAVSYLGADRQEHEMHLVELPSGDEMILEPGFCYEIKKWKPAEDEPLTATDRVVVRIMQSEGAEEIVLPEE